VEDAQAQYEAAIQIDANRAEAYYNLGLLYQDYKSGDPGDLNRATAYYQQFLQRAGNAAALAPTVTELGRRCQIEQQANRPGRRRRAAPTGRNACRPGRVQQIEITLAALREATEMEAEAARMQQEAERLEREAAAQGN
jgi:tetratricopeptide (TPR) repeat protein